MTSLKAYLRSASKKKTQSLREGGIIPAVLYGPSIKKNLNLQVGVKEFAKAYQAVGQTSFVQLQVENDKGKPENFLVLIHEVQKEPLRLTFSHVDFYQPSATKEIKVKVPLNFTGEALAVKNLGGTLVKNIHEVEVKALPQNLPHEIGVDLSPLEELGQTILIKDLKLPVGVKLTKHPEEIVVQVLEPEKIEEELAKPTEEKVEEVKVVEKPEKAETEEASEAEGKK